MNIPFTPHAKRFFLALLIWLAALSLVAAGDVYLSGILKTRADALDAAKQDAASLEMKRSALLAESSYLETIAPDLARIQSVFVNANDPLSFIETLENLARNTGVTLTLQPPEKRGQAMAMRFSAEGAPDGVLAFTQGAEGLPQRISFQEFRFELLSQGSAGAVSAGGGGAPVKIQPASVARASGLMEFLAQ